MHTAGDWQWSKDKKILLGDERTAHVLQLHPDFVIDPANAKLLAAAPEMLGLIAAFRIFLEDQYVRERMYQLGRHVVVDGLLRSAKIVTDKAVKGTNA